MSISTHSVASFYSEHRSWLQGWFVARLGCSYQSADLTHDVFVRLLSREQDLSAIEEPRAFLRKIAQGMAINHWRRKDIEQAYLAALAARGDQFQASPETQYIVVETLCRIDAMLSGLPAKVRQAFLLSRLDGMKYRQIAAALAVSERSVKKYMAQAMQHCLTFAIED